MTNEMLEALSQLRLAENHLQFADDEFLGAAIVATARKDRNNNEH